ncbi:SAM-dependent methyltransferase [Pseudonocardia sp. TRM90224]|uniref:SAM-dependent methyltransferase n=1 Tax=Pseudonocardia sp. TRM90224 TaxID=2812678 RepID=UPI001E2B9FAA|nr:SAM-dependent methyltransferase [Pseudonocardia sp. TRM90224]
MDDHPADLRFDVPHSARIWNHWLGGTDNFAADRAAGDAVVEQYPQVRLLARESRQFLVRAVRFLAGAAGVDQFLDIGAGLPTMENTHQVAQGINPASRVVYVDNDPLVLVHARALLADSTPEGATTYIRADVREPGSLIEQARRHLDFDRPVAVMLLGVMGDATPDPDDMKAVVRTLMAAVPPGSHLALGDGAATRAGRQPEQIAECFAGLKLVEPGVVSVTRWRPDAESAVLEDLPAVAGVARKP